MVALIHIHKKSELGKSTAAINPDYERNYIQE